MADALGDLQYRSQFLQKDVADCHSHNLSIRFFRTEYLDTSGYIWIHLDDLDISGDFQKPEDVAVEWDLHCLHCHSLEAKAIAEQNSVLFAPVQAWSAEVFFHVKGMREW